MQKEARRTRIDRYLPYPTWWLIALTFFFVAVASQPAAGQTGEAAVFVGRAVVLYEEKRYEDALAALQEALRLDPANVDALYYTGLVNIALKRYDAAVDALEHARRRSPRDTSVLFQLGALYFGLEKYDQARPLLEEVFAANPRLDSVGYYVGFMRYRNKDYQGALRAFRAGASSDPNIQQLTRFYSGLALGVLGLPQQAAAEIDEALRLQPASPLTGPAERLRGAVAAAPDRDRRFRADIRAGFIYDDNVLVNPEPSSRDPLVELLRQREQRSFGELASVRLDYSFLRLGAFDATATFSFFTTYNNDVARASMSSTTSAAWASATREPWGVCPSGSISSIRTTISPSVGKSSSSVIPSCRAPCSRSTHSTSRRSS